MNTRLYAVLLSMPLLSGCMMVGMAGMGHTMRRGTHGEAPAMAATGRYIVKEVVADGIRVTADFPPFAQTDSLTYTVTLRDRGGSAITSEASVFLMVSPATVTGDARRIAAAIRDDGTFIFRPSIPRDGWYRLTILVERVGDQVLAPPLTLEQEVELSAHSEHTATAGQSVRREAWTPLVLLGAGAMAVMMILSVR